ncbi:alpha/beta fold hydrolase [Phototrophicus methaneseepsis]|uniref:Alpha/beta fold hydrolase n=1 Tax=Phototrophicus methaneseepsis TaxID=2710758 RepID=A0A7S8IFD0_9CHLR|nr:alpha/beta fold hydrolase [Phototrophicus methaneseepsis]QPC82813.1 alpha/beta fold hydrolase [Phototrophicus methaneseepsis]
MSSFGSPAKAASRRLYSTMPINQHRREGKLKGFRLSFSQRVMATGLKTLWSASPAMASSVAAHYFRRPRRRKVNYVLPQGAQKIAVYHGLRRLTGYRWQGGQKTVLLVHGWESHLGWMLPLVEPLLDAGFSVVAFDGPGHGESPAQETDMVDFGDAVRAAVEQHNVTHIAAHSFGAAATSLVLAQDADLHRQVQGVAFVAPMWNIVEHVDVFSDLIDLDSHQRMDLRGAIQARMWKRLIDCNMTQAARSLHIPGLIIHDKADPIIHISSSMRTAAAWPLSECDITSGLGHHRIVADDQVIERIVGFLQQSAA